MFPITSRTKALPIGWETCLFLTPGFLCHHLPTNLKPLPKQGVKLPLKAVLLQDAIYADQNCLCSSIGIAQILIATFSFCKSIMLKLYKINIDEKPNILVCITFTILIMFVPSFFQIMQDLCRQIQRVL